MSNRLEKQVQREHQQQLKKILQLKQIQIIEIEKAFYVFLKKKNTVRFLLSFYDVDLLNLNVRRVSFETVNLISSLISFSYQIFKVGAP